MTSNFVFELCFCFGDEIPYDGHIYRENNQGTIMSIYLDENSDQAWYLLEKNFADIIYSYFFAGGKCLVERLHNSPYNKYEDTSVDQEETYSIKEIFEDSQFSLYFNKLDDQNKHKIKLLIEKINTESLEELKKKLGSLDLDKFKIEVEENIKHYDPFNFQPSAGVCHQDKFVIKSMRDKLNEIIELYEIIEKNE